MVIQAYSTIEQFVDIDKLNRLKNIEFNDNNKDDFIINNISNSLDKLNDYNFTINNIYNSMAMVKIVDNSILNQRNLLDTISVKLSQFLDGNSDKYILNDIQFLLKNIDNIAKTTIYDGNYLLQDDSNNQAPSNKFYTEIANVIDSNIPFDNIQSNLKGLGLDNILNENIDNFNTSKAKEFLNKVSKAKESIDNFRIDINNIYNMLNINLNNTLNERKKFSFYNIDYNKESSEFSYNNILSKNGDFLFSHRNIIQIDISKLL